MLNKKIDSYLKENYNPFHMPGHKRSSILRTDLPYRRDFTEIDGFDNLNDPKDIFVLMEKSLAEIYKVREAIISTNGSTSGILASIRTLCQNNKNILIQRSSHKAVYNAALINSLNVDYINVKTNDIGAIVNLDTEDFIKKITSKSYGAVVVTSPSYEGYMLDLEKIYKICKKNKTKLLVDMAHGAHLVLDKAYKNTFDIAITSLHKNMSALTPASCVLVNDTSLIKRLRFNMAIFQTSSPSYVILQSIDEMINLFNKFTNLKSQLDRQIEDLYDLSLQNLTLVADKNKDKSKILISCLNSNINGNELLKLLKEEKIEIEMAYPSYALLIASIFDSKEAFEKLKEALIKIDTKIKSSKNIINFSYKLADKKYEIYEALDMDFEIIDINEAINRISGDFIYAYPPGIPLIAPGEVLDEKIIENILKLKKNGIVLNLDGMNISCIIDKTNKN